MKEMEYQVLQWCPTAHDVVTLVVKGESKGPLVKGIVVACYTYNREKCSQSTSNFCWKGHEILTVLDKPQLKKCVCPPCLNSEDELLIQGKRSSK